MAELYICESNPVAVSYSTAAGRTGAVGEQMGGSVVETTGTFTGQGAGNAIMRVYLGPTLGIDQQFSAAVNGTTTFYLADMGPSLGKQFSAT